MFRTQCSYHISVPWKWVKTAAKWVYWDHKLWKAEPWLASIVGWSHLSVMTYHRWWQMACVLGMSFCTKLECCSVTLTGQTWKYLVSVSVGKWKNHRTIKKARMDCLHWLTWLLMCVRLCAYRCTWTILNYFKQRNWLDPIQWQKRNSATNKVDVATESTLKKLKAMSTLGYTAVPSHHVRWLRM